MQTVINKDMAVGIPGTHGNGQPYFADPYIAGANVTMGGVAELDASGNAIPCADASKAVGIFVNPNEHVRMVLPSNDMSLVVPMGSTVAIAKKGSWYVKAYNGAKKGDALKYATTGLVKDDAGTDTVAEVLLVGGGVMLIRFK